MNGAQIQNVQTPMPKRHWNWIARVEKQNAKVVTEPGGWETVRSANYKANRCAFNSSTCM